MDAKELIKVVVLLFLYLIVAPALGFIMKGRRKWQRMAFFAMCFMTISGIFKAAEWGLTLDFVPEYRGHARGFHFFFNEIFAIALIIASFLESPRRFRWKPPGLGLYVFYVVACSISIVSALNTTYTCMAALKAFKVILIFLAAYNFFRSEEDVQFCLSTMSITVLWELFSVLKLKYLNHQYQVCGTFEHQNALAMYAILMGLVLLGAGVGPKQPRSTLYLVAFVACAWIVECTLSRGGLVAFGGGMAGVMFFGLLDKITIRRLAVITAIFLVGCLGVVISLNTIINRFNDPFNQDSANTRVMLNDASRKMLHDYPLGIGWNNFGLAINPPYHYGDAIDDYFRWSGDATKADQHKGIVESHYYLLLSETGYQGFLTYLLLIAFFLWLNVRGAFAFRNHLLGAVSTGIAMGCLANYFQSTLERVLVQPRNMMLWMLLLALTARIESWRREKRKRKRKSQPDQLAPRRPLVPRATARP